MSHEISESDNHGSAENPVADALNAVAYQLKMLGSGQSTDHRGAVEVLAVSVVEAAEKIAMAIESLADAIRQASQK